MRFHQRLAFGEEGHDPGPNHLAEQALLGIEVEIESALAHSGNPGHIIQLGPSKAEIAEDFSGGIQDLLGTGVRSRRN